MLTSTIINAVIEKLEKQGWDDDSLNLIRESLESAIGEVNLAICGLCGHPGADKYAHLCHWPGEQVPDTELVHAACEDAERRRAYEAMTPGERNRFLSSIQ